jgi:tRNA-dihydrouridine synthase B
VHGRTRAQFYGGKADWDVIAQVKRAVCIPVTGNGDIFCAQDARAMFERTGCDAVMVARGSLGNPFIFREIAHLLRTGAGAHRCGTKRRARRDAGAAQARGMVF